MVGQQRTQSQRIRQQVVHCPADILVYVYGAYIYEVLHTVYTCIK